MSADRTDKTDDRVPNAQTTRPLPIIQGWQCPVCLSVYSPTVPRCWYCGPHGTGSGTIAT